MTNTFRDGNYAILHILLVPPICSLSFKDVAQIQGTSKCLGSQEPGITDFHINGPSLLKETGMR